MGAVDSDLGRHDDGHNCRPFFDIKVPNACLALVNFCHFVSSSLGNLIRNQVSNG